MSESSNKTPILIIVITSSINTIAMSIAGAITIMGYDKVIEADATARAAKILAGVGEHKSLADFQKQFDAYKLQTDTYILQSDAKFKALQEDSHSKGK